MAKTVHYRETTFDQRKVLFEEWERLGRKYGSIKAACAKAHVSRNVFYNWRDRYFEMGIEGIRFPESRAPKHPRSVAEEIKDLAVKIKKEDQRRGLRQIAAEIARRTGRKKPSPNTVKKAMIMAGYWFR